MQGTQKKRAYFPFLFITAVFSVSLFTFCNRDPSRPIEDDSDTWTFSGSAINGYTHEKLDSVAITYTDRSGKSKTVVTGKDGNFNIEGHPVGDRSFHFFKGATFTTHIITATGAKDAGGSDIKDVAEVVKLFPLTGGVSGKINVKKNDLSASAGAAGVLVQLTFADPDMATASPKVFEASTDATGAFSFSNLPLADQVKITVSNSTLSGVDYTAGAVASPVLVNGQSVPLATVTMTPANAAAFKILSTGFPSNVVRPNDTLSVTFTEELGAESYAILQGAAGGVSSNVRVTASVAGNVLKIAPEVSLVDNTNYNLTVYGFGATGGGATQTYIITAQGGSLADIVNSNVLSANKTVVDGLGLSDSIAFTFRSALQNTSTATVKKGAVLELVTVTLSGSTLVIKPKGNWESTTYSITVNAVLADGTPVNFTLPAVVTEGALKFTASNIVDPSTNAAKNGFPTDAGIFFAANKALSSGEANLVVTLGGEVVPIRKSVSADSFLVEPNTALKPATSYTLTLTVSTSKGETKSGSFAFTTHNSGIYVKNSNVLSSDGLGQVNVPVETVPYYVLSHAPNAAKMQATIAGGGAPKALVTVSGDTVFVRPVSNFAHNSIVTVTLMGADTNGNQINIGLSGAKAFTTRQDVFVVASNTWNSAGQAAVGFSVYGEMWVKFSENLDADLNKIVWSASAAAKDVYGKTTGGNTPNAMVRVSGDTLFVTPDTRLDLAYGQTVGFQVQVTTATGRQSAAMDFTVTTQTSDLFVAWTNTKDAFGNVRNDFGLLETVKLLPSVKVTAVKAIADDGDGATSNPSDMTLDNVMMSGDTIIFTPTVTLGAGTSYGVTFTVDLLNGLKSQFLTVKWTTLSGVKVASTNTRTGGMFRAFKTIGDSLVVTFTKPVDTSTSAPTRFKVNGFTADYTVTWDSTRTIATIKNSDSLNLATYAGANPYSAASAATRGYTVTFDLTTSDGETKAALGLDVGNIEVHTEYGLAILNSNLLPGHNALNLVTAAETPTDSFPADGSITLSFNRAVDSALIKAANPNTYITLRKNGTTAALPIALAFSSDAKTITVDPVSDLEKGSAYEILITNLPGMGIVHAGAIGAHSGKASGPAAAGALTTADFMVKTDPKPDISALAVVIAMDTNSASSVMGKRKGSSPGIGMYDNRLGAANTNTEANMRILVSEAAWNLNHDDSVDYYQFRVRKVGRTGSETGWFLSDPTVAAGRVATGTYSSFNPVTNANNAQIERTIDLSVQSFISNLRTADKDAAGTDYTNGNDLFNDSARIEIQLRPVLDRNADGDYGDTGETGVWSAGLTFVDNIAPCDSDFVTSANAGPNYCEDKDEGGVTIAHTIDWDHNDGGDLANDSSGFVTLTFPEDMDITTAPGITFKYGDWNDAGGTDPVPAAPVVAAGNGTNMSGWTSGRVYRQYVRLPAVADYTNGQASRGFNYNVSIAGMKDASGNVIASYGSVGNGVSGTDPVANGANGQQNGSASVQGWQQ